MGYMCHHAVLVSSWNSADLKTAHAKAIAMAPESDELTAKWSRLVSPICEGVVNSEGTFMIAPDGSKEGWDTSDKGDAWRAKFIEWMDAQKYDDGSSNLKWALVQFGDEEGDDRVLDSAMIRYSKQWAEVE